MIFLTLSTPLSSKIFYNKIIYISSVNSAVILILYNSLVFQPEGEKMKTIKIAGIALLMLLNTYAYAGVSPKQFCFKDNRVSDEQFVESNVITIEGIEKPVLAQIKGIGEYSINGKNMERKSAIVKNGDRIQVRHKSFNRDGSKVSTILMIGDVYDIFTTVTNKGGKPEASYRIDGAHCQ